MKYLLAAILALTLAGCAARAPAAPVPVHTAANGWKVTQLPVLVGDEIVVFEITFNPDVPYAEWPVRIILVQAVEPDPMVNEL